MTWNHDRLIDDAKDITLRLEDALRAGELDRAAEQCDRLRVLTRFLADEIFAARMEKWDDHLQSYVETK